MSTTILYAWANPLSGWHGADHTWVTSYPAPFRCPPNADYWYCWGTCHPTGPGTTARALGSQAGDLAFAKCICAPNDASAHGGIELYGIQGVCHQLANRILYATGPAPLIVSNARMYWLSHALFGTYGTTHVDWAKRRRDCAPSAPGKGKGTKMNLNVNPDDTDDGDALAEVVRKQMGGQFTPEMAEKLAALQQKLLSEKQELDKMVLAGRLSGREFAERVNLLLSRHVQRVAEVIGKENSAAIFGAEPGEETVIVNPDIAARVVYTTVSPSPSQGGTTATGSSETGLAAN